MRRIAGVKAVRVSLNDGLTVLDFDSANTVTLAQLRTVLKNSGFVAKDARLEAAGTLAADGQVLVFTVSGSGEKFALLSSENARSAYEGLKGRLEAGPVDVELKGTASAPDKKAPSLVLDVLLRLKAND